MHAHRNVSNSSGAIPNINTTRILEKKENWRLKNDRTHLVLGPRSAFENSESGLNFMIGISSMDVE